MRITNDMIFIAIILFLFIFLSLGMSCAEVSPYYKDNLFPRNFVYEPMRGLESMTTMSYSEYNSTDTPTNATQAPNVATAQVSNSGNKVEGFQGLQSSPLGSEKPIDVYSEAKGDLTCAGYGYYNSLGPLCLDKKQINLLQTRGANASGRPDQIGH